MGLGPEGGVRRRRLCGYGLLACASLWLLIAGGDSRRAFVPLLGVYDKSWPHGGLLDNDKSWPTGSLLLDSELREQLSERLREHRRTAEPKAATLQEKLWKAAGLGGREAVYSWPGRP